jgi:hypothetical protein
MTLVLILPLFVAARCPNSVVHEAAESGEGLVREYSQAGKNITIHSTPSTPVFVRSFDTAAAENEVQRLAESPAIDDLDDAQALAVAKSSCEASDLLDLFDAVSPSDATEKVIAMGKGSTAYRAKINQLTSELTDAESSYDQATIAGKAAFCEAVEQAEEN